MYRKELQMSQISWQLTLGSPCFLKSQLTKLPLAAMMINHSMKVLVQGLFSYFSPLIHFKYACPFRARD